MTASSPLDGLVNELRKLQNETQWVEFKVNNSKPEEIGEYISALANSAARVGKQFGYMVWGVSDGDHELVGTSFDPAITKVGGEELESWLTNLLSPKVAFRFLTDDIDEKRIVVLEIPRAVVSPVQFRRNDYIRVGSYKKPLRDHPQLERELWREFDRVAFEYDIEREAVTATEVLGLLDWQAYFEATGLQRPQDPAKALDMLAAERMVVPSLRGGWDITNLGAICLARDLSQFVRLGRKRLRIVRYKGSDKAEAYGEYEVREGYVRGLIEAMSYLERFIPQVEVINVKRASVYEFPLDAVREVIINALIHQDFTVNGAGPMVEIFDGRIEVTNPGASLVETERILDMPPMSRNDGLASFMRRIGYSEERGSGIDKIVESIERHVLPAPEFRTMGNFTRVLLFGPRPFAEMNRGERMRAVYLHTCLHHVSNRVTNNATIRERFGFDNVTKASRLLADAVDDGRIRIRNPELGRRYAEYVPYWA